MLIKLTFEYRELTRGHGETRARPALWPVCRVNRSMFSKCHVRSRCSATHKPLVMWLYVLWRPKMRSAMWLLWSVCVGKEFFWGGKIGSFVLPFSIYLFIYLFNLTFPLMICFQMLPSLGAMPAVLSSLLAFAVLFVLPGSSSGASTEEQRLQVSSFCTLTLFLAVWCYQVTADDKLYWQALI